MDTETIISIIKEDNPDAKFLDGLDEALIGQAQAYGMKPVAAYDYEECVKIYTGKGVNEEDAHREVNNLILKPCFEKGAPIIVYSLK